MNPLAIVLLGYNRINCYIEILNSLNNLESSRNDITLVLSFEYNSSKDIIDYAYNFEWKFGKKIIVEHQTQLGLRKHFIWAGDQTEKYTNVIFLEDDLFVSPQLIDLADSFISTYKNDDKVAGCSFYAPLICEFNRTRFYPIDDGNDAFFLQHPYWGNLWMKKKWSMFKDWFAKYKRNNSILPTYVQRWGLSSFKVVYIQYLIETSRYIVYPRISLVNNMGRAGVHNKKDSLFFQVPILMGHKDFQLKSFDESLAVYDSSFEIDVNILKKTNPLLSKYDFCVNLQNNYEHYNKEYILTHGNDTEAILSFSNRCKPYESAIIQNIQGNGIELIKNTNSHNRYKDLWFLDFRKNNMFARAISLKFILRFLKYLFTKR